MQLSRIRAQNYRSIVDQTIDLDKIATFCGPNNAGKSNLLSAVDTLFGQKWPPYVLTLEDRNRAHPQSSIILEATLDGPVVKHYRGHSYDVWGFRLTFDSPDATSFLCLDQHGGVIPTVAGGDLQVDNATRNHVSALHVEAVRDLSDELRASQWSFMGRILSAISNQLAADAVFTTAHTTKATDLANHLRQGPITDFELSLNEEMRGITGFSTLSLTFQPPGILESLKALRINVSEATGLPEAPAEQLGQGMQSALVIAIVRAFQKTTGTSTVLLIEEPESYLHPQGRRAFHSTLCDLAVAGRCQILCTTHSTEFIDLSTADRLYVVRKDGARGTIVSRGNPALLTASQKDELKLATEFNPGLRETIFARCAILCEGPTEEGAIPELMRRVSRNPDSEGISVRSVEGKESLPFMINTLRSLGVPVVVVHDSDRSPDGTIAAYHVSLNAEIETAVGGPDKTWVIDPDFETAFSIPRTDRSKARRALLWARGLNEAEATRIITPLLTKIDALV
jgi:putative ATP-dependent endonuclease of the OLD family